MKSLFIAALILSQFSPSFSRAQNQQDDLIQFQFRKSVEFGAIAKEIYRAALSSITEQRRNSDGRAFAVVFDVDDTLLDSTEYQQTHPTYDGASWNNFVSSQGASAVPGAQEFIEQVRKLPGCHIAFITDRTDSQAAATIGNLRKFSMYQTGDLMLTKQNTPVGGKPDTKDLRRECVEQARDPRCAGAGPMPILAFFGDSAGDFEERHGQDMNVNGRQSIGEKAGTKYWVIPNPIYGQWQQNYK